MSVVEAAAGGVRVFADRKIATKLTSGFAVVCIILGIAVGYTLYVIGGVAQIVERMVTLRAPVALESTEMVGNVYSTLATLRGYLLTGNPQGRNDRAAMWKELDATIASFDKKVERFTNPENKRKWTEAKALIEEFRTAQAKAEAIAFTPDAFPATKILAIEAAPRNTAMFVQISKMIDDEEKLAATPERKRLLKVMADVRGNFAAATAQLRMYLLSGDKTNKDEFARLWEIFEAARIALGERKALLTPEQMTAFEAFSKAHEEFAPLPAKMFAIRESAQWNVPVHILVTEAAPRALKILDLVDGPKGADGTRSGGIKTNQKLMLAEESEAALSGMAFLKAAEWTLLVVGLLIAALTALLITRSIAAPIRKLTAAMRELAEGNFSVVLPGLGRKDEIGDIAGAVGDFKLRLEEKMRLDAEKEHEIARREQAERDERARKEAEMARMVAKVVAALGDGLENLARGNLTYRLTEEFAADYKKVRDDFNSAIGQLQETISNIAASSAEISNAASEISTSTTDLSQRTEEQAASLEQTSASM
jgi:methyl-accepting chemotaxis protein